MSLQCPPYQMRMIKVLTLETGGPLVNRQYIMREKNIFIYIEIQRGKDIGNINRDTEGDRKRIWK